MIDCKITENYLSERKRMCISFEDCTECDFQDTNGCKRLEVERTDFEKAIGIVQKWSNEHAQRTLLTEFLRNYPDVELNTYGYPTKISPCSLCIVNDIICGKPYSAKATRCQDCWNIPIEHVE